LALWRIAVGKARERTEHYTSDALRAAALFDHSCAWHAGPAKTRRWP
jgi:hypothetical protein